MNGADRALIAATLAGNTSAYGELVLRYQDRLYNAVLRIVARPEDALDVVQDTFVSAFQSLSSFKGESEFYTWLYRIAYNAAITHKRKTRFTLSLHPRAEDLQSFEPADDRFDVQPGAALERTEQEAKVHSALKRLSAEHRTVLMLKDIDGLKYEQIAEIMQIPIGTVRSRLHRARLELKVLLEPDSAADEKFLPPSD